MEWRANNKGDPAAQNPKKEGGGKKKKKSRKEKIAAAVEKKFARNIKEEEDKQVKEDEARAYIMGLLNLDGSSNSDKVDNNNSIKGKLSNVSSSQTGSKVTLQGIIKDAKNRN